MSTSIKLTFPANRQFIAINRLKNRGLCAIIKAIKNSDEEKKMRRLLCPESKGNAETFAIIPLYDVVSELLIESRIKNFWFDE